MPGLRMHKGPIAAGKRAFFLAPCLLAAGLLFLALLRPAHGDETGFDLRAASEWGGHLRLRGSVSDPAAGSRLSVLERERLHDLAFELRSKYGLQLNPDWAFDLHYEMIGTAGETRQADARFFEQYPLAGHLPAPSGASDERRLMDLTHQISSHTDYQLYHRLDRLSLTARSERGSMRIGRQALTWGNGFLFNPMDLFNPFSPTDVERDYKIGDDMVSLQVHTGPRGELQMLYVPRRNPATHDVAWDQSSAAVKYHTYRGGLEVDLMAGEHYDDAVFGIGFTGYLGGAAWRLDATYTALDDSYEKTGYAGICANLDYSWAAWGKNMYAWIEGYYTGLGISDYEDLRTEPALLDRLRRGERFTLGRAYLDASLQVEFHPLINGHFTFIANLRDPSGALQPRLVWEPRQDLQVTAGANLYFGGTDTEFGGIDLPGTRFTEAPADNVYLWLSFFY